MARGSKTTITSQPEFSDALSGYIARGNIDIVRRHLDDLFWQQDGERPGWEHLKLALLRADKPMTRLLVTWGARATDKDLARLQEQDPKKYPEYLRLLRQSGHGIALEKLAESTKKAESLPARNESLDEDIIRGFVDDRFIDHRVARLPREWRQALRAFHDKGAEEAVIAGGALRDLFNDRAVKDVDIFLKSRGSTKKNRKFLKNAFAASGLSVARQAVYTGGYSDDLVEFPDPKKTTFQERQSLGYGSFRPASTSEAWTVIAGPQKTEYNIVFIDGPLGEAMQAARQKNQSPARPIIGAFDFGLCHIGYDGDAIVTTPQYRHDVRNKIIKLERANGTSREHLSRIVKKYPDWKLCPESEKVLNPPAPPKKPQRRTYGYGGFYY